MSELPCHLFDVFLHDASRRGLAPEELVRGVDVTLEQLRDRRARISWLQFSGVLENLGRHYSPDELAQLGAASLRWPSVRPFALVSRLLLTTRDTYRWCYSADSPALSMFGACMSCDWVERSETEGVITITLKEGRRTSAAFNHVTRGVISEVPRLVGEPPAQVTMEQLDNGVRYLVRHSARAAPLGWLRKGLLWPFTTFRAGHALKEAHEALSERFLELHDAKQLLAAQATQLQTAHSISQLVHSALDLDRTMDAVANAFTRIGGFAGAHVIITGPPEQLASSGERRGLRQLLVPLKARGEPIGAVELWYASGADASERSALAEMVAPTMAMAIDGARAYAALLDAQQHLERRVQQRTLELSDAQDALKRTIAELQAAERARARLFANVNHEIRTPLTVILLLLEMLRRSPDASAERDRALVSIDRNARKLLRLIDGLLVLAAADESRTSISPALLDLEVLVGELLETFGASARACGVKLHTEIEPGVVAEVDESAVERILSNLLSNAIKFTPAGGEVVVRVQRLGGDIVITVSDTGIGISEGFLARIFGRFEQDGRPLRPGTPGSGIGLSLVRHLAEAHCGRASVERLEQGTRFRVVLPLVAQPGIRRAPPETARPRRSSASDFGLHSSEGHLTPRDQPLHAHTLLVVEDDPELRARIAEILSPHYNLIEAADAERAIELAEAQRPDLLLSDIGLPGADGLELTRRFAALPGNRLAPVLLLTAFASIEHRLSGFEAGAIDYLTKPFNPRELLVRIQAQLDRRQLALQLNECERMAAIGTMATGLAHELGKPASALLDAVEPLIELLPAELKVPGGGVSDLLKTVRDCSAQIGLLSCQLLGLPGGRLVAREPVDATQLVARALGLIGPAMRDIELRSELRFVGQLPCSPALILQVLGDLLDNAVQAARLSADPMQRPWVSITTYEDQGRFLCEVADSGPGVASALRERIFDPVFATKAPGQGSGLGLPMCRRIAQQHQGALFVHESSDGSVFRLELPISASDAAAG